MNEKLFLRPLLALTSAGLLALILSPQAHIGRGGFVLGRILACDVVILFLYMGLRRRFNMRSFSQRGFTRPYFWLLLAVPLFLAVAAVGGDISARRLPLFKNVIRLAQGSKHAMSSLGEPMKVGWPVEGDTESSGNSGRAILSIPIAGSKGQGYLRAVGTKSEGNWKISELALKAGGRNEYENILEVASR